MANVKDGATSLVATAPSPATSGTSLVVTTGEGALFPTPPFYAIAHPANTLPLVSVSEKVLVTAKSTDTLTITRAQGGYTARSIAVGWRISNAIFQDDFNNASIIKNEVPSGLVNSSNTAYTIASAGKVTGSLEVYKNGLRLKGGGVDYTESATGFTATTAPTTGAVLLVDYIVAGQTTNVGTNSLLSDEAPTGTINGSNTNFVTVRPYVGGTLEVFVNGVKQARGTHFTETTPSTGAFAIIDAPLTGDNVIVNYSYNLNPSSNADTVDGINANTTATANNLMPLDSNALYSSTLLSNPYKFSVYRNSSFNSGNGAFAKIQFDTESFDTGGSYDNVTNYRFTAPVTGFYFFNFNVQTGNLVTNLIASFFKNGSEYKRYRYGANASTGAGIAGSDLMSLTAGDYVEVHCFANATTAMDTGEGRAFFTGFLVSKA
jgi:hypothetical protein